MKKKFSILMITLLMVLAGCGTGRSTESVSLMTWGGDFIPREIISEFEEETGIKVDYKEITSNEDMQSLLETSPGQYDLAVVTDYMVDILRQNDDLLALDKTKMPNIGNINPNFQSNYYDENNDYSIPYAVSTALMLVNPSEVEALGASPITSYADLWQEELKNNVVIIDGATEVIGIVSKALGQEVNNPDPAVMEMVKEKLFELRPQITRFETNTPEDSLISREAVVGFMYSNQVAKAITQDSELSPVFASEGTPIFIDSFVMSKDAPNPENTYKFLDFLMRPEISAKISELTQFTSANSAAEEYLSDEFRDNPILNMSDEVSSNTFFYTDLELVLEDYDFMYSEFKTK